MSIDKLNWKEKNKTSEDISNEENNIIEKPTYEGEDLSVKLLYDKINEIIEWINNQ